MSIKGKSYPFYLLLIPLLIILTIPLLFNLTGAVDSAASGSVNVLTEMDFADDPGLSAFPEDEIVAVFLEAPTSVDEPHDTGEIGLDVIPYKYEKSIEQTFCWDDDNPASEHFMTLYNSTGDPVITVDAGGDCITETIAEGEYEMHVSHDGKSDKRVAVFIVPEGDKALLTTASDETLLNLTSVLNSDKCIGCDLSNVNLSSADLSGVDLTDAMLNSAILVDADLSGANLQGAQLQNADLSRANLGGANLAGADLTSAILINADLSDADLTDANLDNADMTDAILDNAIITLPGQLIADPETDESEAGEVVTAAVEDECMSGTLDPGDGTMDLKISALCNVGTDVYRYQNVNIIDGGELRFLDTGGETHFWAKSILVEKGGSLTAGEDNDANAFGANGGTLIIHLYGSDADKTGIGCKSMVVDDVPCGIDPVAWKMGNTMKVSLPTTGAPVMDYFYEYQDPDDVMGETGLFGRKVLAVSYGGTLKLFGSKGSSFSDLASSDSGKSWARLDGTVMKGETTLKIDRPVDWKTGDRIVLTTTDYLPGHSELLEIIDPDEGDGMTFNFKVLDPFTGEEIPGGLQHEHNGDTYPLTAPDRLKLKIDEAETRAAVALLSRSIRIVSAGNEIPAAPMDLMCKYDCFPEITPMDPQYYYGGHLMARQGVKELKIQGVEFFQLGQGGRKGRYPAHMHLLRKTPPDTYLKDNSVHDSMTRWYTLHGTQDMLLARNVGFMSIGHGYYIEDGTEINNKFYSNIGIFARGALDNKHNPRKVPGILAWTADKAITTIVPTHSDYAQPTIFWIMNGWNDFEYNMAAGANACGVCYWWLPGQISGPSQDMMWDSYAAQQNTPSRAGITPLKNFKGNYCTTAMTAFNSIKDISPCLGIGGPSAPLFEPITEGNIAPEPKMDASMETYYPKVEGSHFPTRCKEGEDCTTVKTCSAGERDNCMVAVIDSFTTAFNWTETNFAAIWLRPQWYLVIHSVISDVQNAGLSFVTGGDYTLSNFIPGQWQLARQNVFIGETQGGNPYASADGPVNKGTFPDLQCEKHPSEAPVGNYCLLKDEGVSIPLSNFANNQRLFNIYDGPSYEDSNAFFNIKKSFFENSECNVGQGNCVNTAKSMYGGVPLMPYDKEAQKCFLPHAAIAWKQPNGFYYPPAFHSSNLFFEEGKVDIRHFVIEPLFVQDGPFAFQSDDDRVKTNYCTFALNNPMGFGGSFGNFSAIDRQTILNDDDGTLTGLKNTISVNEDPFFKAPTEAFECESEKTAKTSPYEYVTTAVYPGCVAKGDCGGKCKSDGQPCAIDDDCAMIPDNACILTGDAFWRDDCGSSFCYGVPLYRQLLTKDEEGSTKGQEIRMMGMNFFQRSNLTANNGIYYIDTTVSQEKQKEGLLPTGQTPSLNVFKGGETYYVLLIFAKETTKQTYLLYVGENYDPENDTKGIRSSLKTTRPLDVNPTSWPEGWVRKWYKDDPSTGILEVFVDFSADTFKTEFDLAKMDRCKPESFCTWTGPADTGSCGCSMDLMNRDPELYTECTTKLGDKDSICDWAVRAVDCPEGGCYGFSFTLVDDPPAEPMDPPAPSCFPDNDDWNVEFMRASDDEVTNKDLSGSCFDTPAPSPEFCDPPGGGVMPPPEPPPVGGAPDMDGDGIPDAIDADMDGDGILNDLETAPNGVDLLTSSRMIIPADPDGDGIPNELDLDSDGDCLPDHFEAGGTNDADRDGMSDNFVDADADGHHDAHDASEGGVILALPDTDGDQIPNFLDNDSDNDGMTDTDETGGAGDANDDGVLDDQTDANEDGLADIVPATGNVCLILDTDGDGLPDHLDLVLITPADPPGDGGTGGNGACALASSEAGNQGLAGLAVFALIPLAVVFRRKFRAGTKR